MRTAWGLRGGRTRARATCERGLARGWPEPQEGTGVWGNCLWRGDGPGSVGTDERAEPSKEKKQNPKPPKTKITNRVPGVGGGAPGRGRAEEPPWHLHCRPRGRRLRGVGCTWRGAGDTPPPWRLSHQPGNGGGGRRGLGAFLRL